MQRRINILSLAVLFIYGTLTLVAVPLHHHAMNYVDSPQYQTVVSNHASGCDVCTLASTTFTVSTSSEPCVGLTDNHVKPFAIESTSDFSSLFSKEYPRRGPPAVSL